MNRDMNSLCTCCILNSYGNQTRKFSRYAQKWKVWVEPPSPRGDLRTSRFRGKFLQGNGADGEKHALLAPSAEPPVFQALSNLQQLLLSAVISYGQIMTPNEGNSQMSERSRLVCRKEEATMQRNSIRNKKV